MEMLVSGARLGERGWKKRGAAMDGVEGDAVPSEKYRFLILVTLFISSG